MENSVIRTTYLVSLPIIMYGGLLGNTFAIFLVVNSRLRKYPSSQLLAALSVFDSCFLLTLQGIWLQELVNKHIVIDASEFWCRGLHYLTAVSDFCSVWLLVAVTVERYLVLHWPQFAENFVTNRAARLTILVVLFCGLVFCSWLLPIMGIQIMEHDGQKIQECNVAEEDLSILVKMNMVDTLLSCFIPTFIILPVNTIVIRKLWHAANIKAAENNATIFAATASSPPHPMFDSCETALITNHTQVPKPEVGKRVRFSREQREKQHTKMLIVVSTLFVLLNFPSYLARLAHSYQLHVDPFVEMILYLLYFVHHAITFYVYSLYSPVARQQLIVAAGEMRCCCKRPNASTKTPHILGRTYTVPQFHLAKFHYRNMASQPDAANNFQSNSEEEVRCYITDVTTLPTVRSCQTIQTGEQIESDMKEL